MTWHQQVVIKVNAEVDEGIVPLVLALNAIDGVITQDSCQEIGSNREAWVFFSFGETWQDLARLMQDLSSGLSELSIRAGYALSLEWLGSDDRPRGRLSVAPQNIAAVADGIERVVPILGGRPTGSVGGR